MPENPSDTLEKLSLGDRPGRAIALDGSSRRRANVLGVGIDAIDMRTAVARVMSAVGGSAGGYVCVTGVHGVIEASRDASMRSILNNSLMTTPDGMPMVWVGRAQGHKMSRVYGPDLMLELCVAGVERRVRHFFYGGNPGVAEALKTRLVARIPGLMVVGTYTPPFRPLSEAEERDLAAALNNTRPDVMWIGLSTPKQERFMAEHVDRLPCRVMIGVGAAFDMHTGRISQAPRWMQRSGFEWLYRLVTEPRRLWKRYLINNPLFLARLVEQWLRPSRYPAPR